MVNNLDMIQQKNKPDLATLIQLAERKADLAGSRLTLYRTEYDWRIAPVDPHQIKEAAGYESLYDALTHYLIGEA